ncbi:MAG: GNAT family N-acetyltransferase [Pseudomonadota bacterium]
MEALRLRKLSENETEFRDLLSLIQRSFAFMEGRIDPPSSMNCLTEADIRKHCEIGEIGVIGDPITACVFLRARDGWLYLSKLAVDEAARGLGLARHLVDHAMDRARDLGLQGVELETRVELIENHTAFARMGFAKTGDGTHAGFDRPTYIVMRRSL